jgi:hypothetical protein
MAVRHALEHVFEIGEWLDVVELGGGDEGADRRPAVGAPVGSGKQVILAAKRDGTNRALDGVGIKFDASVLKEVAKSVPAVQRVTHRISKAAAGWDVAKLGFQPELPLRPAAAIWLDARSAEGRRSGHGW